MFIEGLRLGSCRAEVLAAEERRAKGARLLSSLEAQNTEPMVPLKREEVYDPARSSKR